MLEFFSASEILFCSSQNPASSPASSRGEDDGEDEDDHDEIGEDEDDHDEIGEYDEDDDADNDEAHFCSSQKPASSRGDTHDANCSMLMPSS